jgi:hypothetical protein
MPFQMCCQVVASGFLNLLNNLRTGLQLKGVDINADLSRSSLRRTMSSVAAYRTTAPETRFQDRISLTAPRNVEVDHRGDALGSKSALATSVIKLPRVRLQVGG